MIEINNSLHRNGNSITNESLKQLSENYSRYASLKTDMKITFAPTFTQELRKKHFFFY